MFRIGSRIQEFGDVLGTGPVTLTGATDGMFAFASLLAEGDKTWALIEDTDAAENEICVVTMTGGTLVRGAVVKSTNGGAAVNFSGGPKLISQTLPGEKLLVVDDHGNARLLVPDAVFSPEMLGGIFTPSGQPIIRTSIYHDGGIHGQSDLFAYLNGSNYASGFQLYSARGTPDAPADLGDGDNLGWFQSFGYHGGDYRGGPFWDFTINGTPGVDGVMPVAATLAMIGGPIGLWEAFKALPDGTVTVGHGGALHIAPDGTITGSGIGGGLPIDGSVPMTGPLITPHVILQGPSNPAIEWNNQGNAANLKRWDFFEYADGNLYIRALNDDGSPTVQFNITRAGHFQIQGSLIGSGAQLSGVTPTLVMFDSVSGLYKYVRNNGGTFEIYDASFGTRLFAVEDNGKVTAPVSFNSQTIRAERYGWPTVVLKDTASAAGLQLWQFINRSDSHAIELWPMLGEGSVGPDGGGTFSWGRDGSYYASGPMNCASPVAGTSSNDGSVATTNWVKSLGYTTGSGYLTTAAAASTYETQSHATATYAPLASPALTGNPTAPTPAAGDSDTSIATTAFVQAELGYLGQTIQAGNYQTVQGDAGGSVYHAVGAGAAVYTIPANTVLAYALGTTLTFVNDSATAITITSADTLVLSPGATTGTRTLAQGGIATAYKATATRWLVSGTGLT